MNQLDAGGEELSLVESARHERTAERLVELLAVQTNVPSALSLAQAEVRPPHG